MGKKKGLDSSGFLSASDLPRQAGTRSTMLAYALRAAALARSCAGCRDVRQVWLAFGWEGWLGIFLVEVESGSPHRDRRLWVVSGEFPPAIFHTDGMDTAADVLEFYLEEMEEWARAIHAGHSTDGLIPVRYADSGRPMPQVLESANRVSHSMRLVRDELLPELRSQVQ